MLGISQVLGRFGRAFKSSDLVLTDSSSQPCQRLLFPLYVGWDEVSRFKNSRLAGQLFYKSSQYFPQIYESAIVE